MKNKFIAVTSLFAAVIVAVTAVLLLYGSFFGNREIQNRQIILVSEAEHLIETGKEEQAKEKLSVLEESIQNNGTSDNTETIIAGCGICITFIVTVFLYIYFSILRPFRKMEKYVDEIAKGNLDIPLKYERSNYFGKFTWAFDSMRKEIIKARACEKNAVENNKTIIATLSHDIKTPIASIRAYAEGLSANLDNTPEKRERYISVIIKKCDEVVSLTDDLFLHSVSALDMLKISCEPMELCEFVKNAVSELEAEKDDISLIPPDFNAEISADKKRLMQIIENLISNSRKYAKTKIIIDLFKNNSEVTLKIRDYGNGIPDNNMPFIFDKFYRGNNCGDEDGSGLGLYTVKYLTEKMNGKVLLHNLNDGLSAEVTFPVLNQPIS